MTATNKSQLESVPEPSSEKNDGTAPNVPSAGAINNTKKEGIKGNGSAVGTPQVPLSPSPTLSTSILGGAGNGQTSNGHAASAITNLRRKRKFSSPEEDTPLSSTPSLTSNSMAKRPKSGSEPATPSYVSAEECEATVEATDEKGKDIKSPKPTKAIHITIKPMMGESFVLSLADDSCVFELKDMITERTKVSFDGLVLSFPGSGKMLVNDEEMLEEAKIQDGTTLLLTVKVSSGQESGYVEYDDLRDFDTEVIYDVSYPDSFILVNPEDTKSMKEILELAAANVIESADETSPEESKFGCDDEQIGSKQRTSPLKTIERLLEDMAPRLGNSIEALDSLRISNSSHENSSEEFEQSPTTKSANGPKGGEIFKSPLLSSIPTIMTSSLTGSSNCHKCHRKCRIAQRFECRCGHTFCPTHRYGDQHGCTYDFKAKDREAVEAANPKIIKSKIDKV